MIEWLRTTLLFGAARVDADPLQMEDLKALVPSIKDPGLRPADIEARIGEIMGEDWEPRADFKAQIETLT